MPITLLQRRACAEAAASGLPFALWHLPHGRGDFTLIVSIEAAASGPVFGPGLVPGFVIAPFQTSDATQAWIFPADVLITADKVRFRRGREFVEEPVTNAQARIAESSNADPVMISSPPQEPLLPTSPDEYRARVSRAVEAIRGGLCEKIVLSRIEPRELPAGRDLCDLAEELADIHPHAFTSLVSSPPTGTWLTATPEILLSTDSTKVRTMALAGTQWPDPTADLAVLQWPEKIVDEQALVAKFIRDAFQEEGFTDLEETVPYTVRAANLCHLRSDFCASFKDADALSGLLRRLHPTSAVCGMPKSEALDFILGEEGATRAFYTGYLGPRGVDGETRLYVNLRSARIDASRIYLHVGGGIVEASDPELEWQETVEKTKTIAQVLHPA